MSDTGQANELAARYAETCAAFSRRLGAEGFYIEMGPDRPAQLCAALAGRFALAVNAGKKIAPQGRLTDRECAVLWLGAVGTDAASQAIEAPLEQTLPWMPAWVCDLQATDRGLDLIDEVIPLHNRMASGPAAEYSAKIGATFLDWARTTEARGVDVLRRHMLDIADVVGRFR
jgi:hypothetical protein